MKMLLTAFALFALAPLSLHAADIPVDTAENSVDATAVNVGLASGLEGTIWSDIKNASPEHALFFVGLREKFRNGIAVDLADWHTVTLFKPTTGLVDLMNDGSPDPQQMKKQMEPLEPNQVLKVEARARRLDDGSVRLTLTTVLESASSPAEKTATPLYSRTYYLTKIDHGGPAPTTQQGEKGEVFALTDADDSTALSSAG